MWTHKKFALALGGGSARGLAHIGVLQFLEENNFSPSLIAGTSMGSLLGALFALGYSADEIKEITKDTGVKSVINFNPVNGIFGIEKFKKMFAPHFGDKTFADTKIPLKIIATSLSTGQKVVFTEWKILDAVCASVAIPGVFSPYKIENEYFIDGGMRENLPLSECENLPTIASSVVMPTGHKNFKKVSHFLRPLVSVYDAFSIMLEEQEKLGILLHKDVLLLKMSDKSVHYMDFEKGKKLVSVGYNIAKNSEMKKFLEK